MTMFYWPAPDVEGEVHEHEEDPYESEDAVLDAVAEFCVGELSSADLGTVCDSEGRQFNIRIVAALVPIE